MICLVIYENIVTNWSTIVLNSNKGEGVLFIAPWQICASLERYCHSSISGQETKISI